ncbi:AraC family transcriptional regulator [Pseudomonas saliphila]|uniref:AraC family transcriptional regulator n=1 Tax=Pseudomonas saliphila TaxID=2586906 RepID=UPI00123AB92B|nr:AraC family transcriptional regulator [Pseudomonas saliphila]
MKSGHSGWVLAIARTLDAYGLSHTEIFRKVGMDPSILKDANSRYWQEMISRLWRTAVKETGDPNFGLKVATQIRPSSFHVVGHAMSCSATLGDAIHRFARYAKLISSSATIGLTETEDSLKLNFAFDTGDMPVLPETMDTVVAGLVCFNNWIVGEDVAPMEVRLMRQRPEDPQEYLRLMKCPVLFEQQEDCIIYSPDDMLLPMLSADEHLAATLDSMAATQLAQLSERFARKVRECLVLQLSEESEVSRRTTAQLLNMTERTLLRRLKEEGTTFQEVLDHLREELAYEYLQRPDCTVQTVSFMLGFSDASTFSRAFKRWTGHRPSLAQHTGPHPHPDH